MSLQPYDVRAMRLAAQFLFMLEDRLGHGQFEEVVRLNRKERNAGICHSHDFCDANIVMAMAMKDLYGYEPYDFSDADNAAARERATEEWNNAWDLAVALMRMEGW